MTAELALVADIGGTHARFALVRGGLVENPVVLRCADYQGPAAAASAYLAAQGEAGHPVQAAFIAEQAAQCGFCTAGMVVESAALLDAKPQPSLDEAKAALGGHLCRCGSHQRILRAVMRASGRVPS